jgi:hypothetical protein
MTALRNCRSDPARSGCPVQAGGAPEFGRSRDVRGIEPHALRDSAVGVGALVVGAARSLLEAVAVRSGCGR